MTLAIDATSGDLMLKNLALLSVNFRRTSLADLGDLTKNRVVVDRVLWHLKEAGELDAYAVLATCNRFEVMFVARSACASALRIRTAMLKASPAGGRGVESFVGVGALRHLLRVASSLDSLAVGEGQILRQVKVARDLAREAKTLDPQLEIAFDHALAAAKAVRTHTQLGDGRLSVASLAASSIEDVERRVADPVFAIVGAGDMAKKAALHLSTSRRCGGRLLIVNRTRERAAQLAAEVGAECMTLAEFRDVRMVVDVLVTATSAQEPLFDAQALAALARRRRAAGRGGDLVAIDLAMPGNLGVADEPIAGCRIRRLDDLRAEADDNRARRFAETSKAEQIVERKLAVLTTRLAQRAVVPLLHQTRADLDRLQQREVERAMKDQLAHLGAADKELIRQFAAELTRRCAERSMGTLRGLVASMPHAVGSVAP